MVTWAPGALERGRGKITQGHLEEREKRTVEVSGRSADGPLIPPPQDEFKPHVAGCWGPSHAFASSLLPGRSQGEVKPDNNRSGLPVTT